MKKRTIIDMGMIILAPILMAYSMAGEMLHEFIGITMFILFICHHVLNRKWLTTLRKGKWNAVRSLNTVLDFLILLLMLIMMISAPTISKHALAFLDIGGAALGRTFHLIGANWLFVLMSLHLGLHVNSLSAGLGISNRNRLCRILNIICIIIAIYGCYALISRGMLLYMFATQLFAAFDLSEPLIFFILDYMAIMDLFAVIGFYIMRMIVMIGKNHTAKEDEIKPDTGMPQTVKRKKRGIVFAVLWIVILVAGIVWGVPYMRRHFVTVTVDRAAATLLPKVDLTGRTLIVQFTRTGNTDFAPDVDAVSSASLMIDEYGKLVGNAELLAEMVQNSTGADLYPIRVRNLYPSTYSGTINVAGEELRTKAYPELNTDIPLPVISDYDRIILVFPLWWGTVPKAVEGFLSQEDFTDKDVYLILTHGGGKEGSVPKDLPGMLHGGRLDKNILLVYDDETDEASEKVYEWLKTLK